MAYMEYTEAIKDVLHKDGWLDPEQAKELREVINDINILVDLEKNDRKKLEEDTTRQSRYITRLEGLLREAEQVMVDYDNGYFKCQCGGRWNLGETSNHQPMCLVSRIREELKS